MVSDAKRSGRKILWGMLGGCAVVAAMAYLLWPDPVRVDLATVSRGPLTVTAREDGLTRIRERYEISTPLAGRLRRITLNVGDAVRADETVVATLEPTLPSLLDPRAIAQAKARVRAAQQRSEVARLQLATAEAEAEHAAAERLRIYQLRIQDAVSETELQAAELEARLKADARRAAEYAIEIAEYEAELEQAALLLTEADPTDGSETMELAIRAPIDGRVLRLHREDSAVVPVGTVLMEVGDPSDLELVVDVLSRDAVRIRPGADVVVRRWGGDEPLHGQVRYVEPSGFTKISALGVEEQRVDIVIDLREPPEQRAALGDAFRIEAEITLWHADDRIRIPTAALFRQGDDWATFVVVRGTAEMRLLSIGQMSPDYAEVLSGVDAGQTVIEYPSDQVRSGTKVLGR